MLRLIGCEFNPEQASIVCTHVTDGAPIVEVAHDLDRVVQVFCEQQNHDAASAQVVHLQHLQAMLAALALPDIHPGQLPS